MKLTEAQRWALQKIAEHPGIWPSYLGQKMMERPGVEEKRRGGNRSSAQGLGRIGGMMMSRLSKAGLVETWSLTNGNWHATKARITTAGRQALATSNGVRP